MFRSRFVSRSKVRAQDSDACPEPDGFFADAEQCDRYYECTDNVLTEKLCPDGQVFADLGIERCDYPFNVDCTGREKLRKKLDRSQPIDLI